MTSRVDDTHDPHATSWVDTANAEDAEFPIQNLPLGVVRLRGATETAHVGVAIGDQVLDLVRCRAHGLLGELSVDLQQAIAEPSLNRLMALGHDGMRQLRRHVSRLLRSDSRQKDAGVLIPIAHAECLLPVLIGDYTDFYASIFHATRVGRLFRPDNPLLPNYRHVPIAYHGRSSSVIASGTPVGRPRGQSKTSDSDQPTFGPSARLDFEAEVGIFVGRGNELGQPIAIDEAEEHVAGLCLLNDWSARDLQAWESQPLGPFLSKSFATTVSPWIVTLEALAPFRCPAAVRSNDDPRPLPYLASARDAATGGIDVSVEVLLQSAQGRARRLAPVTVSRCRFRDVYWTIAQMVAHHTSNGCNLRPGDLLGSGTISGPEDGSEGCLLEITRPGGRGIELPTGERRGFLADGDEVILRARCARDGYRSIGFGECAGMVLPVSP